MKRYAVCGVSNRAIKMFIEPMVHTFAETCELVGLLDKDERRHHICKKVMPEVEHVPTYRAESFERMIRETRPDVILVAGRDDTHAHYVVAALEHDLDVVVEKPMATTAKDCRTILEAEARSEGRVHVTFNYRYSPYHTKIKELILQGRLGKITSVDLNWYIDTYHGSSYFQRWNRMREYSGGLSVHKSAHHFDLVSWWLDQRPVEVFAYGALNYYGQASVYNPSEVDGRCCATCEDQSRCDYYRRWNARSRSLQVRDDHIGSLPTTLSEDAYTGYRADRCVFDSEIDIEDTYASCMKYDNGAMLSYSVNFSVPYEGYRLAINGTHGRLETMEYHEPSRVPFPVPEQTIDFFPLFGSKETIHVVKREGGHGGGDPVLQEDVFLGPDPDRPYTLLSGSTDGAYAVAAGEAVWRSVKENRPIGVDALLSESVQT